MYGGFSCLYKSTNDEILANFRDKKHNCIGQHICFSTPDSLVLVH